MKSGILFQSRLNKGHFPRKKTNYFRSIADLITNLTLVLSAFSRAGLNGDGDDDDDEYTIHQERTIEAP